MTPREVTSSVLFWAGLGLIGLAAVVAKPKRTVHLQLESEDTRRDREIQTFLETYS